MAKKKRKTPMQRVKRACERAWSKKTNGGVWWITRSSDTPAMPVIGQGATAEKAWAAAAKYLSV